MKKHGRTKDDFNEDDDSIAEIEFDETDDRALEKLKRIRTKLADCESEKKEHLESLQRAKADFLNSKRRLQEQLESDRHKITAKHIEDLLPLCDSFDMALSDTKKLEQADVSWKKGFEQMHSQLEAVLKKHGVIKFGALGDVFNPNLHEAVSSKEINDKSKHNRIITVLQHGYQLNDMVIRPAKVVVGENI